jgi:hypothetical protein
MAQSSQMSYAICQQLATDDIDFAIFHQADKDDE